MAALLATDNIGRRIDIFERRFGPPDDAGKDWTRYTVEGCLVNVDTQDAVITWIGIGLSRSECKADLSPLLSGIRPITASTPLTFAEFDALVGGRTFYSFPCPGLDCGNAFDPWLIAVRPGAHVDGFIDIEAKGDLLSDYETFGAWKDQVRALSGEEYYEGNLECDRRFDEISRRMLASAQVFSIGFGHRKPQFPCD